MEILNLQAHFTKAYPYIQKIETEVLEFLKLTPTIRGKIGKSIDTMEPDIVNNIKNEMMVICVRVPFEDAEINNLDKYFNSVASSFIDQFKYINVKEVSNLVLVEAIQPEMLSVSYILFFKYVGDNK